MCKGAIEIYWISIECAKGIDRVERMRKRSKSYLGVTKEAMIAMRIQFLR